MTDKIQLIALLCLILLLFWGLRWFHRFLIAQFQKELRHTLNQVFVTISAFAWGSLILWSLHVVFQVQQLYSLVLFVVLFSIFLGAGWFLVQDLIAGLVLKIEEPYEVGDRINLKKFQGKVSKVGLRSLWLLTEEGNHMKLPYRFITGIQVRKSDESQQVEHVFQIKIPKRDPLIEIESQIQEIILTHPASVISKLPSVQLLEEIEDQYFIEITFLTLDRKYTEDIKEKIRHVILPAG